MSTPSDLPATANVPAWDRADSLGHALARRHAWPGTVGRGPLQLEPGRLGMADIGARHLAFATGTLGLGMQHHPAGRDALTVVRAQPVRRRGGAFAESHDGLAADVDPANAGASDPLPASGGRTAGQIAPQAAARSGSPTGAMPDSAASRASATDAIDRRASGEAPDASPSPSPVETEPEPAPVVLATSGPERVDDLPVSNPRLASEAARRGALPSIDASAPAAETRPPLPAVVSPAPHVDPAPVHAPTFPLAERPSSAAPSTVVHTQPDAEARVESNAREALPNAHAARSPVPAPSKGHALPSLTPPPAVPVLARASRVPTPTPTPADVPDPLTARLATASLPPRPARSGWSDAPPTGPIGTAAPLVRLSHPRDAATDPGRPAGATALPSGPGFTHRRASEPAHPPSLQIDLRPAPAARDPAAPSTAPLHRSAAPAAVSSSSSAPPEADSSTSFSAAPAASSRSDSAGPMSPSPLRVAAPAAASASILRPTDLAATPELPLPSQALNDIPEGAPFASFTLPVVAPSQRRPDAQDDAGPADASGGRGSNRASAVGGEPTPTVALAATSDRRVPAAAPAASPLRQPPRVAEAAPANVVAAARWRPSAPRAQTPTDTMADAATTERVHLRYPSASEDLLRRRADAAEREPPPPTAVLLSPSREPVPSVVASPLATRAEAPARVVATPGGARPLEPQVDAARASMARADAAAFDPFDLVAALPAPPARDLRTARDALSRSPSAMAPAATGGTGSLDASGAVHASEQTHGVISVASEASRTASTPQAPRPEAPIDVEDIVERAVEALLLKLDIERERRGFARWA